MVGDEAVDEQDAARRRISVDGLVCVEPAADCRRVERRIVVVAHSGASLGDVVRDDAVDDIDAGPAVLHVDSAAVAVAEIVASGHLCRAAGDRQVGNDDVVGVDADASHGVRAEAEPGGVLRGGGARADDERLVLACAADGQRLRYVDAIRHAVDRRAAVEAVHRAAGCVRSRRNVDYVASGRCVDGGLDGRVGSVRAADVEVVCRVGAERCREHCGKNMDRWLSCCHGHFPFVERGFFK